MKRALLLLTAAALTLLSCSKDVEVDSAFIAADNVQLKVSGRIVLSYDPLTWQLGFNPGSKEFRVTDDAMKNCYIVTCSDLPSSTGQKINATVSWTSGTSSQSVKGKFEVVKTVGDTYWLWCGDKKVQTGVTVIMLR